MKYQQIILFSIFIYRARGVRFISCEEKQTWYHLLFHCTV